MGWSRGDTDEMVELLFRELHPADAPASNQTSTTESSDSSDENETQQELEKITQRQEVVDFVSWGVCRAQTDQKMTANVKYSVVPTCQIWAFADFLSFILFWIE